MLTKIDILLNEIIIIIFAFKLDNKNFSDLLRAIYFYTILEWCIYE